MEKENKTIKTSTRVADPREQEKEKRLKLYYFAFCFYAIAPICLLIFIIDQITVMKTDALFLGLFFFILLPCMFIGFVLSLIGFIISSKRKNKSNITIGLITTLIGGAGIVAGLGGWGLLYVITS